MTCACRTNSAARDSLGEIEVLRFHEKPGKGLGVLEGDLLQERRVPFPASRETALLQPFPVGSVPADLILQENVQALNFLLETKHLDHVSSRLYPFSCRRNAVVTLQGSASTWSRLFSFSFSTCFEGSYSIPAKASDEQGRGHSTRVGGGTRTPEQKSELDLSEQTPRTTENLSHRSHLNPFLSRLA